MFNLFKKKEAKQPTKNVVACATGKLIDITTVSDPMFAQKMMGDGFAIKPYNGKVVSPIDGEITVLFPTGHAFGVVREDGLEVLVHIGIDTVNMKGEGFKTKANKGDKVHAGDTIVKIDLDAIKEAGYDSTIMTIFTGGFTGTTENLAYNSELYAGDVVINND